MKTLLLLLPVFLFSMAVQSQVYSLNNGFTNGGEVTTCTGIFKDSNRFGNYQNNEDYVVSFKPNSVGRATQLSFDTLSLDDGDTLWIFDGSTALSPVITFLVKNDPPPIVRASALNIAGVLTVKFTSNGTDVNRGWSAQLSCKSACQQVNANVVNITPGADANGFINICKGQELVFNGNGVYPQNNLLYHQSDSSSRFTWRVSDGYDTTGTFLSSFRHRFNSEGGFIVELRIIDSNGCTNLVKSVVKVRTGIRPVFNVQTPPATCAADTVIVTTRPRMATGSFTQPPIIADSIFLPDGLGVSYQTSLNITQFAPGQTLNNLSDLQGILLNMEHSWLGDLEMSITAPNGIKVRLKFTTGTGLGWDTFLGEPVDEPSANSPLRFISGKGYDYLFSPTPTFGTMNAEKGRYIYSYVDNVGQTVTNHTYLPAGSYASEESLAPLIGTPLNGLWTITVTDKFSIDNGFIFYWTIKFNPAIYPTAEVYNTQFSAATWSTGIINGTDTSATIVLNTPGTFPYKYSITDAFGCTFDTTFNLVVNPTPIKPNLGNDTAICNGQAVNLSVKNAAGGVSYLWSTGASGTNSIVANQPGMYWVQAQNSFGCKRRDTIQVNPSIPYTITLKDTMYCAGSNSNQLTPVSSVSLVSYLWSNGSTGNVLPITAPSIYWVEGTDNMGCKVRDSNVVVNNPVNSFSMPRDTSICELTSYTLALQPPAGTSITWMDGSTGNSHLVKGGAYSIAANYAGCIKTSQMQVGIRPLPVISVGKDTSLCYGFELPLRVSYPGATYVWNTGSTDSAIIAKNAGFYWAQATLNGCSYRDTMEMKQRNCECDIRMPSAFSPNGDGINDLYIPNIQCFPKDFHLSVFNRYGQVVFDTKDYKNYWNGTINGSVLPVGTFYYILTFYNDNLMQTEQRKGSITLLR